MARRDTRSEMQRRASGFEQVAFVALAAVAGCLAVLWCAGVLASVIAGRGQLPAVETVMAVAFNPGHAGQILGTGSTLIYWAIVVAVLAVVGLVTFHLLTRTARAKEEAAREIGREKGLANKRSVQAHYGARAVLARGHQIRPDFRPEGRKPVVGDYAYWDGVSRGVKTYTTFETPTMVIAPSRAGKSQSVIGPRIAQTQGAVLSTSTKVEIVNMTWDMRKQTGGPMLICDPEGVGRDAGLPGDTSWCLWNGCEDLSEALERAKVLAAGGTGGVENSSFWSGAATRVLTPLLHAAALEASVTLDDFQEWCLEPKAAMEAVEILRSHGEKARGAAKMLESVVEMEDLETRGNLWASVANLGTAFVSPYVRETFGPSGKQLDIDDFLARSGTIYLLGQEDGNASQLILTLVDAVWRKAVRRANSAPGGRIEPPMHYSLDEIGNIGVLPQLPRMLSEGGGLGIQTTAAFQSLAQAERRYGAATSRAMWESATQRIVLGGVDDDSILNSMSRAAGTRTVVQQSVSSARRGERVSSSFSEREENVLEKSQIQTMRKGLGCVIEAAKPLIVVSFEPFFKRYAKPQRRKETAKGRK